MLSITDYKYKSWKNVFADEPVDLSYLPVYSSEWKNLIGHMAEKNEFKQIETLLANDIKNGCDIYPYPNLLFNALNKTKIDNIKVVILGQDPYINANIENNTVIPQAMGMSFSVPIGMSVPPSLKNIFKNQMCNHIITEDQPHGNLEFWADQGCLMLNTALTVRANESGSHCSVWKQFSDKIIKYISDELDDVIFVLWGKPALDKMKLIDAEKHTIIVSSHPSGLSYNKPLLNYPAFATLNHFGMINKYLTEHGHDEIMWNLIKW